MKKQYNIIAAEYIGSYPEWEKCQLNENPEYAFIGRSNVGKSSFINLLTLRNNLALTSAKPGKTRMLNLFLINSKWNIMDLPGYGYAKVSKTEKEKWEKFISAYILNRPNLMNVFVLIDSSIPFQSNDIEFINNLGENGIPFSLIFTKTDKISPNKIQSNISGFIKEMKNYWTELPLQFMASAINKTGREEVLDYIFSLNLEFASFKKQI
jgi:GTP-binding protein